MRRVNSVEFLRYSATDILVLCWAKCFPHTPYSRFSSALSAMAGCSDYFQLSTRGSYKHAAFTAEDAHFPPGVFRVIAVK
jgi:hypothetical protein